VSGHTPGPWIADDFAMEFDRRTHVGTYDGTPTYYHRNDSICECYVTDTDGGKIGTLEAEANARLIAAAPDLLAALKHCVIERSEWLTEARAAIAKAEGRTP
jgi:hypothetical protein